MKRLLLVLAVSGVFASAATATATWAHSYQDELWMSNTLEAHGIYFHGHLVPIDNASCTGLRRYGVRTDGYGLDKFWRFRCDADAADNHIYDVEVSTTTGPKASYVYWHFLSVRRQY